MAPRQTSEQILRDLRKEFPYLKKEYHVKSMSLFGSYARRDETEESDIDILVTFTKVPGFFKYIELENYLSQKLGVKVDLVMDDALKKNIGNRIKAEAVPV